MTIDWKEYFNKFSKAHGGNPVEWKGQLLFQDGWRYEMRYQGPEHEPPKDEAALRRIQLFYWTRRRKIVRQQVVDAQDSYNVLVQQVATRSMPLVQRVSYLDEDDGRRSIRREQEPFDITVVENRLSWMKADLEHAENMMRALLNPERVEA